MDRIEMYMVETYKCEELKKTLKPITDWSKVKEGTKIFNDMDNNIYNDNVFISYDKDNNIIEYAVIDYHYKENKEYTRSANGWYYYDESIADKVEEMFTPRLYELEGMMTVAFNKDEALKYLKEKYTHVDFSNRDAEEINHIDEVDDFKIELK